MIIAHIIYQWVLKEFLSYFVWYLGICLIRFTNLYSISLFLFLNAHKFMLYFLTYTHEVWKFFLFQLLKQVKNFVSLGGPHAGTASVPLCGVSIILSSGNLIALYKIGFVSLRLLLVKKVHMIMNYSWTVIECRIPHCLQTTPYYGIWFWCCLFPIALSFGTRLGLLHRGSL